MQLRLKAAITAMIASGAMAARGLQQLQPPAEHGVVGHGKGKARRLKRV